VKKYLLAVSLLLNAVFLTLVIRHYALMYRPEKSHSLTFFSHRDQALKALPKDTTDVLFIGDSKTASFEVSELFNGVQFKNRGIAYDSNTGVLYRAPEMASGKPEKVFIEIGINDLAEELPLDSIKRNVQAIIDTFKTKSPGTQIYIESILPTSSAYGNEHPGLEKRRQILNTAYHNIAQKKGICFINLEPAFNDNGLKRQYDSEDGIHLNEFGYILWRDKLIKYLKNH
jgi:hypothetical protein